MFCSQQVATAKLHTDASLLLHACNLLIRVLDPLLQQLQRGSHGARPGRQQERQREGWKGC